MDTILESPILANNGNRYKFNEVARRKILRIIQWSIANSSTENLATLSDEGGQQSMTTIQLQALFDELEGKAGDRASQVEDDFIAYRPNANSGILTQKDLSDWAATFGVTL